MVASLVGLGILSPAWFFIPKPSSRTYSAASLRGLFCCGNVYAAEDQTEFPVDPPASK